MNVAGEELSQSASLVPEKTQRNKKKKKKRCFEFCKLLHFGFRHKVVRIEKMENLKPKSQLS